jgi:hypothetical protein
MQEMNISTNDACEVTKNRLENVIAVYVFTLVNIPVAPLPIMQIARISGTKDEPSSSVH